MPACPRKEVFDPEVVGVYHCWNRCVRRAWLCGFDSVSGRDYEYRRRWIEERLMLLARCFAIEIGWHAVMSNHIHLILRNRPDVVAHWSDEEVVRRMLTIHRLTRTWGCEAPSPSALEIRLALADPEKVACYRRRLADISWFMASLDEYVARRCNREDGVTGAFWEGRFGCRSLEDEPAILVCGMYIDLNPIQTGEACSPETARYTSAWHRIQGERERTTKRLCGDHPCRDHPCEQTEPSDDRSRSAATTGAVQDDDRLSCEPAFLTIEHRTKQMPADGWLCELTLHEGIDTSVTDGRVSATPWRLTDKGMLPLRWEDYLALLRWTAEQKTNKPEAVQAEAIPRSLAAILQRLRIRPSAWLECVANFEKLFGRAVGRAENLARRAALTGRHWLRGQRSCATAFS